MSSRLLRTARLGLFLITTLSAGITIATGVQAAPYAAMVVDAKTGAVIHEENADTRLHPASLTKMMTLYIAFQAIQRGEISLDSQITIPKAAAAQPPSKLGLRTGQKIKFRYLLRAAAVKSANDAATAIGFAISGSEEAFAKRMNATAQAMGMRNTTFVNQHGLTHPNHLSSARDMTVLGRHMIYDFPQYYNLFSRRTADAGIKQVNNTNRRFLAAYEGADGIKTGFTNAAGYNLVASAKRGDRRIIATVFGGTSTANRNARVMKLLDKGFASPAGKPATGRAPALVAAAPALGPTSGAHTIRVSGVVRRSLRPQTRPGAAAPAPVQVASTSGIEDALAAALLVSAAPAAAATAPQEAPARVAVAAPAAPVTEFDDMAPETAEIFAEAGIAPETTPQPRPTERIMTAAAIAPVDASRMQAVPEVVTRVSTSGGRLWGINVGRYNSRNAAERVLIQTALNEPGALDGALRRVTQRAGGFDANFMGLTNESADLACRRLQARGAMCFMIGPS
ncbi:D-alanyl-D-alanine carboxypeptidase family protein [Limimaricola cinnabarinus]|uniref:D-alanyl-D-alanine carboxypeptidase family protein n=1 Tax=Limimaricola cinnabarinus TaxID=1125964 RepID=UPI003D7C389F